MSRHTVNDHPHEMRVPDVQQHVVHPPRSIAPSIPASEDPGSYRHMDEIFNHDSHRDESMYTQSLLRLARNLLQAPHRPTYEPEHGSLSVQSSTRQRALARSTATLDQPSWHGSSL